MLQAEHADTGKMQLTVHTKTLADVLTRDE